MNTTIFTQLSETDIRAMLRAELEAFFREHFPALPTASPRPSLGGLDLAVEVTGLKKPTLYSLVHRRVIPFFKQGKKLYFKREDLEAWIEDGRKLTASEIAAQAQDVIARNHQKR
jgi:excisionase family DNA binding protein